MKHVNLALILLLATNVVAFAQDSPADLVKKLSSGSYQERERAALMLVKLGKTSLAALNDASEHADLETRRRVVVLIERIEDNINVAQVTAATPITLQFKNEAIGKALRATTEHMGLPVGARTGDDQPVNLDAAALPYWQAWQRFCTAARLEETDWAVSAGKLKRVDDSVVREAVRDLDLVPGGQTRLLLPRIQFGNPVGAYVEDNRGSVRTRVRWHALDASLGKQPCAVFAVEVRPEPRLEIVAPPRVEITRIVDADGKERSTKSERLFAAPTDPRDALLLEMYAGEIQFGGLLHLKAIPWQGPARPLKELQGRVRLKVATRGTLLAVNNVVKAEGKELRGPHGIMLKVLEMDRSDGEIVVRMRLENLSSLTPQSDDQKIVRVRPGLVAVRGAIDVAVEGIRLRDDKGWLHAPTMKTEHRQLAKDRYEVSAYFATPSGRVDDVGLVLTKSTRTAHVDVPFQVNDISALKK